MQMEPLVWREACKEETEIEHFVEKLNKTNQNEGEVDSSTELHGNVWEVRMNGRMKRHGGREDDKENAKMSTVINQMYI